MRRRQFITLLGGAAALPLAARAQQPAKMLRVGTVAGTPKSSPQWVAFERRMGELGYQEGKNFSFDFLQAASADEDEVLYRKLAVHMPDVILAIGPEVGLKSALAVTRTLPIVMIAIDYDPFARGYVTNLARPSGNVTGVVFQQIELAAKRIQLIKDAFRDRPAATMFWDRLSADQWQAAQSAAATLGLQLSGIELRELPYDYDAALDQAPLDHRDILIVPTSPFFFRDRARLADFALRHRILSMFVFREWVDAGGLLCYGPSITALFGRVAEFVDRIARGAKPADLPIEQPTKFEMVVNLKTARAIGIDLPTAILLRADEVIE
ncbi:MAG TPA: ABC transporter substrate-binding protein [Bradyrhizobium sp.]|nr:ABC transporter substrate-binding protein [Bradyrhizobium sp.]